MNLRQYFALIGSIALVVSSVAWAAEQDGVIFDGKVGVGSYYSPNGSQKTTNGVVDVSGVLIFGDESGAADTIYGGLELGLLSGVRAGSADILEGEVSLKGRYMFNNKFGIELKGLPFRYIRDDRYYELSIVEISGVMKVAEGAGHQLFIKAGINPYTKRVYGNEFKPFVTTYDPVQVTDGYFSDPSYAQVYGQQSYSYDGRASNTDYDNSQVYFGGGTMSRQVATSFETAEQSFRIPVSIEYKFKDSAKKLTIKAEAYYVLRVGVDSLKQTDRYTDEYRGYVSYSNVHWDKCYYQDGSWYYCNPASLGHSGEGVIKQYYDNTTTLDSKTFVGQTFGGKLEIMRQVVKTDILEFLLGGQVRAEYDTHIMDGTTGEVRDGTRVRATAEAVVRF